MNSPALRPLLLWRGLTADRRDSDLKSLAAERDPEKFIWRILPYAARSFATSIVVLRKDQARAAAVAYLYCRMLDTYEDLIDDPAESILALRRFAGRFECEAGSLPPPELIPESLAREPPDRLYLLLIARCKLVDRVFAGLSPEVQSQIRWLVRSMAEGMAWSTDAFARQGGVLTDEEQLALYCRNVIGQPALFVLKLTGTRKVTESAKEDALLVSEMVQLANVSRDIERDLARGIAYHPALKPHLGNNGQGPVPEAQREAIRQAREEYLAMALNRAPAYRRLFDGLDLGHTASVRTAAVLMLLFTDLHYRSCAIQAGRRPWRGPRGRVAVILSSAPALMSARWARRIVRRVEDDFAGAAEALAAGTASSRL